jgi:cytochrome c oxidase subunit 3
METAIHHDEAIIYKRSSKFAMIIFLASEFMLFAALFATYIILRRSGDAWLDDRSAEMFAKMIPMVVFNSFILIGSSFTYHLAESAVQKGKSPVPWLFVTLGMGTYFLLGQVFEWSHMKHEGLWFDNVNLFCTNFFTTTGFHGFHVFVGLLLIVYVMIKGLLGHYTKETHISLQNIGYYWHFVDAVWLVVFALFYGEHLVTYVKQLIH